MFPLSCLQLQISGAYGGEVEAVAERFGVTQWTAFPFKWDAGDVEDASPSSSSSLTWTGELCRLLSERATECSFREQGRRLRQSNEVQLLLAGWDAGLA